MGEHHARLLVGRSGPFPIHRLPAGSGVGHTIQRPSNPEVARGIHPARGKAIKSLTFDASLSQLGRKSRLEVWRDRGTGMKLALPKPIWRRSTFLIPNSGVSQKANGIDMPRGKGNLVGTRDRPAPKFKSTKADGLHAMFGVVAADDAHTVALVK